MVRDAVRVRTATSHLKSESDIMFEPENDIERMLVRAADEPSERPVFARALLDAEIFIVLVPEGGRIVPGPDGKMTIPEGTRLVVPSAMRGKETLFPFFTTSSRARAWFEGEHIVAPDRARDLFGRHPDTAFVLNPGSDYGKVFTPAEVTRFLAGRFEEEAGTAAIPDGQELLLGRPRTIPDTLVAALGRELGAVESVHGAWLMLAAPARDAEQIWMLGVDHDAGWSAVQTAIDRAVAGDVLEGRLLDAVALDGSPLSSRLRTGIPIIAARRGALDRKQPR